MTDINMNDLPVVEDAPTTVPYEQDVVMEMMKKMVSEDAAPVFVQEEPVVEGTETI